MTRPNNCLIMPERVGLSFSTLSAAAELLRPARHYTLVVGNKEARHAAAVIAFVRQTVEPNPFAPTVGLRVDDTFSEREWALEGGSHGECVWTEGT